MGETDLCKGLKDADSVGIKACYNEVAMRVRKRAMVMRYRKAMVKETGGDESTKNKSEKDALRLASDG
jgi:hypothetical protein